MLECRGMKIKKETLSNGLRVIFAPQKTTDAVSVLVLVGAGSRYEEKEENGIAHFLEHMFFKGGDKYKNTKEIAEAIDSGGGEFNAFTGKEYAGYYVKIIGEKMHLACEVLGDMISSACFPKEEIEKERNVILEEYNMYQDMPNYQVGWEFENLMFGNQPLGMDQLGSPDFIKNVPRDKFVEFKDRLYYPENIVVCVAGSFDEEETKKEIEKNFIFSTPAKVQESFLPYKENFSKNRISLKNKSTEQSHIVVGFQSFPFSHPHFMSERLLAVILGGNMSSRMFLNIREKKSFAYYIHTTTDNYHDVGTFSTNAGVQNKNILQAVQEIKREYQNILKEGENIPQKEIEKSKSFTKGKIALSLEDSDELAHLLAKTELLEGSFKTPQEIYKEIDSVNAESLSLMAQEIFTLDKIKLACIGPHSNEKDFLKIL